MNLISQRNSILIILIFLFTGSVLFAQTETKKSVDKKLKNINNDVSKIIIETEDDDIEFEGKEAALLLKRLKYNKKLMFHPKSKGNAFFFSDDNDSTVSKHCVKVFKFNDGDETAFFSGDMDDDFVWEIAGDSHDTEKEKINVEIEGGEKKVTLTTFENGEEKVKTYTGDDADEFLEKHHNISAHGKVLKLNKLGNKLKWIDESDGDVLFLHKLTDKDSIKVEVEDKDGELKVTVTKNVDGEPKVTEYTGEDAEKYLEKHEGDKIYRIKIDDDSDPVFVTKIKRGNKKFDWFSDDELTEDITVDVDDSTGVLTVITSTGDEEDIKIIKGIDIDEFLEKHTGGTFVVSVNDDDSVIVKMKDGKNIDEEKVLEWTDEIDSGSQTIKYYTEDGIKKLNVNTKGNGEITTQQYEGREAKEKFEELMNEHKIKFKSGNKKSFKKIIIK